MKTANAPMAAGDGWQQDPRLGKLIADRFAPGGQVMVPNNPQNAFSYMGRPSESMGYSGYDQIGQAGLIKRPSPYGDGAVYAQQTVPTIAPVSPAVMRILAPDPKKGAADQPNTPGYSNGGPLGSIDAAQQVSQNFQPSKPLGAPVRQSVPLGMSTSLDALPFGKVPAPKRAV